VDNVYISVRQIHSNQYVPNFTRIGRVLKKMWQKHFGVFFGSQCSNRHHFTVKLRVYPENGTEFPRQFSIRLMYLSVKGRPPANRTHGHTWCFCDLNRTEWRHLINGCGPCIRIALQVVLLFALPCPLRRIECHLCHQRCYSLSAV